jgi:hypothetical protein
MGGYTRAFSRQQLSKHVPVARQKILNNTYNSLTVTMEELYFLRGPYREVIIETGFAA